VRHDATGELRVIAEGLRFPEGPVAMPDGTVLVVAIARGTLTRVHPDGRQTVVAEAGGGPNGAAIGPAARAVSARRPHGPGHRWRSRTHSPERLAGIIRVHRGAPR